MSTRPFLLFWLGGTLGVLTYAFLDLQSSPSLAAEKSISMRPDLSRLPDLAHWGGRLMHHDAWGLLLLNAIVIGGLLALLMSFLLGCWTKRRSKPAEPDCVVICDD